MNNGDYLLFCLINTNVRYATFLHSGNSLEDVNGEVQSETQANGEKHCY